MATILYFPEDDFAPSRFNWLTWARAEISSSPAHARAIAEGRSRRVEANAGDLRDVSGSTTDATDEDRNVSNRPVSVPPQAIPDSDRDSAHWTDPPTSISTVFTDCAGSPSESRCSKSQLANILSVRDERVAAEARRTVRPIGQMGDVDQAECPNCHLPEDECFCVDENDFHGDQ